MFHKKRKSGVPEKSENNAHSAGTADDAKSSKKFLHGKIKIKTAAVILAAIAAVTAVILIVLSVNSSQGIRKSQKLAKRIGDPVDKAASAANVELADSSDFEFVNELSTFSAVVESGRKTRVYDTGFPEWVIYCGENAFGNLESVTYCDFRILSSSINGVRKSGRIDTSRITAGSTLADTESVLGMDPYQIVYSESSVSRKYRYFYKDRQTGDVKAYIITVIFGKDNIVNSPVITEENNFLFDALKIDKD